MTNEDEDVLDIDDDQELAAFLDGFIQPKDIAEKKAHENMPLSIEGIPKMLLPNYNDRTKKTSYNHSWNISTE